MLQREEEEEAKWRFIVRNFPSAIGKVQISSMQQSGYCMDLYDKPLTDFRRVTIHYEQNQENSGNGELKFMRGVVTIP